MAKAINYGVIYGLSSFGLAERTGTSRTEAQRYIDTYFARYSKVKDYLDGLVEEARTTGRVRTAFGRLRPMPEINSGDVQARNRAEREAMNTPLQGTAADSDEARHGQNPVAPEARADADPHDPDRAR